MVLGFMCATTRKRWRMVHTIMPTLVVTAGWLVASAIGTVTEGRFGMARTLNSADGIVHHSGMLPVLSPEAQAESDALVAQERRRVRAAGSRLLA